MEYPKRRYILIAILAVALALRLGYALAQDPSLPYGGTGGDSGWYLYYGRLLVMGRVPAPPPSAPFYLIFLGVWQRIFSPQGAVIAVRVVQCLLATVTCYFAYRLGEALAGDERAGRVAAGALAVSPAFVMESAQVTTETLYIFFVTAGLWVYVYAAKQPSMSPRYATVMLVVVALLFGLATLTRAVSLLFPLVLAFHWLMVCGRSRLRAALRPAMLMLAAYAVVVSIWTVYNLVVWNYFVVGAQGWFSFLYLGATDTGWTGPYQVDAVLTQQTGMDRYDVQSRDRTFQQAAISRIADDPSGWIRRRVSELASAYLQPHGTVLFPGESLKDMALNWLQSERTLGGLARLTQGDYFWQKLSIYFFHYGGLLAGAVGMWLCRRQWRVVLPMMGFILYTTLIHLVLLALPRYIFPTAVMWWAFAAAAIHHGLLVFRPKTSTAPVVTNQEAIANPKG